MKTSQKVWLMVFAAIWVYKADAQSGTQADTSLIKTYLTWLTDSFRPRIYSNREKTKATADFIAFVFKKYSDSVSVQTYETREVTYGVKYKNIICSFGTENPKRIIIGAHYDVCDPYPGADDNGSGVAGLLELARMLKGQKLKYRVDLVAYALEEPPFFATKDMGSYIHAKSLFDHKTKVYGMVSLEMIGYFARENRTQQYPLGAMSLLYGNRGNFIALVKKLGAGRFARKFCRLYKHCHKIKTIKLSAPRQLEGIDYSDHRNYWAYGYSALMITDTSYYRNHNYHHESDTMDTLDIRSMAKVIDGVYQTLLQM